MECGTGKPIASADARDFTPEPPAELSPWSIYFARACLRHFAETGENIFPRGADWTKAEPEDQLGSG